MAESERLTDPSSTFVVSDTTALTTLLKTGLDWLLPELFGRVLIPGKVSEELLAFHSALPEWGMVREAPGNDLLAELQADVDAGEAEAIALAASENATILIDDKKARRHAEALGLTCLGLPAVLVTARREGLIISLADAFATLAAKGRYRVDAETAIMLLRSVGEE